MIDLQYYGVEPGTHDGKDVITPGGVPQIYQLVGMDMTEVSTWDPLSEVLYDDRIAIPFTTRGENPNGVTIEQVLAMLIHRLQTFQSGKHPSPYNQVALEHLERALRCMQVRMTDPSANPSLSKLIKNSKFGLDMDTLPETDTIRRVDIQRPLSLEDYACGRHK